MPKTIESITRLKAIHSGIAETLNEYDYTDLLSDNFVSSTGLTKSDILDKVQKYKKCSSIIEIFDYTDRKTVHNANFCQNPHICPVCSARTNFIRRGKYINSRLKGGNQVEGVLQSLAIRYPFSYMLNFTVPANDSIEDQFNFLRDSIKRFRKMGQKRKSGYSGGEWAKVEAALMHIEVKRGKNSKSFHIHAHCLVFTRKMLDFHVNGKTPDVKIYGKKELIPTSKLSYEWYIATGGKAINIKAILMKRIPDKCSRRNYIKYSKMSYHDSIAAQSMEVMKYTAKPNNLDSYDIIDLMVSTHNRRFFSTFGDLRGLVSDHDEYELKEEEKPDKIYSMRFDLSSNEFQGQNEISINSVIAREQKKKKVLKLAAVIQGEYRKQRTAARKNIPTKDGLSVILNNLKSSFRDRIKRLWGVYHGQESQADFIYKLDMVNFGIQQELELS